MDTVKETFIMLSLPEKKVALFPEKILMTSDKVTPIEEVEKYNNILNDMEDPVHTIGRKDLDKFQGQSTDSTGCLNLYHEWLKRTFSILEPEFYKKFLKRILKVKI